MFAELPDGKTVGLCRYLMEPMAGQSRKDWVQQTLILESFQAAAQLPSELERQLWCVSQDSHAHYHPAAFRDSTFPYEFFKMEAMMHLAAAMQVASNLPPFRGHLAIRPVAGSHFAPSNADDWVARQPMYCSVSIGDVTMRSKATSLHAPGQVCWGGDMTFELSDEPKMLRVEIGQRQEIDGRRRTIGLALVPFSPLLWSPHPNWRRLEVGINCSKWRELGFGSTPATIGVLVLEIQYSFCRTAPAQAPGYHPHPDNDDTMTAAPDHLRMLRFQQRALHQAIGTSGVHYDAVGWLAAEFAEVYGISKSSRLLVELQTVCAAPACTAPWFNSVRHTLANFHLQAGRLLADEHAAYVSLLDFMDQLLRQCFTLYDVMFPVTEIATTGAFAAAVAMLEQLVVLRDSGDSAIDCLASCLAAHAAKLCYAVGQSSGGAGGGPVGAKAARWAKVSYASFAFLSRAVAAEMQVLMPAACPFKSLPLICSWVCFQDIGHYTSHLPPGLDAAAELGAAFHAGLSKLAAKAVSPPTAGYIKEPVSCSDKACTLPMQGRSHSQNGAAFNRAAMEGQLAFDAICRWLLLQSVAFDCDACPL